MNGAKYLAKNSWKAIPVVSLLYYEHPDNYEDEEDSLKRIGKVLGHLGWAILATFYVVGGVSGSEWNPIEQIKDIKKSIKESNEKTEKLPNYKSDVMNYVDKDNNGLSNKENYQIKELMKIQNYSKTYVPTFKDWERAYNKIK